MTAKRKRSFEEGMQALEALTDRLSGGEMTLDETMKAYEEGVALAAQLEQTLLQYKKKIEQIDPDTAEITPFEENEHGIS